MKSVIKKQDTAVKKMMLGLEHSLSGGALAAWMTGTMDPWVRTRAKSRFANEGDDASGKWAPLAPATQDIRENLGYGRAHPINRRTSALEQFITGTPGQIVFGPNMAVLTYLENVPSKDYLPRKVEIAQLGEEREIGDTPARPVLDLGMVDLEFAMKSLANGIFGSMGLGAGLVP